MSDLIDRQAAIDACYTGWNTGEIIANIKTLPSAKSGFIMCKECKWWIPGFINDQDDFIPPKCGKYQQMVGHSATDYCSLAEAK